MVALKIEQVGDFMNKFLLRSTFDGFDFVRGDVTGFAVFTIDGRLQKDFYSSDEQEEIGDRVYVPWTEMKPRVCALIRGKNTPLSMHFVMRLSDRHTQALLQQENLQQLEDVVRPQPGAGPQALLQQENLQQLQDKLEGLYLNIRFARGELECVTGVSFRTFVADRSLEFLWDRTAARFLSQNGIAAEVK